MSPTSSPALILRFPEGTDTAARERLVTFLSDFDLIAIHEDDPSTPRAWTVHFASAQERDDAAGALAGAPRTGDAAVPGVTVESVDVEDEDWARRTQADLPAIRIGRIVVAPPWDLPSASAGNANDIVVEIEPSRGFGTGHHQSTRLCLVLLQTRDVARRSCLDVGTGSGVLAIAAAKLGAAFVSAIDVDPDAIENARENATRNGVDRVVESHVRDFSDPDLTPADIVTANLTGTLLARHGERLAALVRPGGSLIVAGFTIDEKPLVLDAFAGALQVTESAEEEGWWALVLTKL